MKDHALTSIPEALQQSDRRHTGARAARILAAVKQIENMTPTSKPLGRYCKDIHEVHSIQVMLRQAATHLGWVTEGMLKKMPAEERAGKQVFRIKTRQVGDLYAAIVVIKNNW